MLKLHVCQKKFVCASISSFPFLLLPVWSIVTQNILPSPVGSPGPLAPRKMCDTDALTDSSVVTDYQRNHANTEESP